MDEIEYRDFSFFGSILADLDAEVANEGITKEDRDRMIVYAVDYGVKGEEPQLQGFESLAFRRIKAAVNQSLEKRKSAKKGGRPRKNEVKKTKDNEEENLGLETEKPRFQEDETSYLILSNHKEKNNKKENLGEEKTGVSQTKPDVVRCSYCGTEVKKRQTSIGSAKPYWVYVCEQGHACDSAGNAKNHGGAQ